MNKIAVFGTHERQTLAQLEDVASRAERAALMADGHLGYVMPIGGVAAYREQVSVRVPEREALFSLDTATGQHYWALMTLAGEYAYAGREWVARKVVSILDGRELELVHNHHNFAWREEHDGETLVVIRKGATPAASSGGTRRAEGYD